MGTVLRVGPYRFFFYGADGKEPRHVHVERDQHEAKFWLGPPVHLSYNQGFGPGEIRDIQRLIRLNLDRLRRSWDEFFLPKT